MDASKMPDITKMTLVEAKDLLLAAALNPGESHDLNVESIARDLMQAAEQRRRAEEVISGTNSRRFYGSADHPDAPSTSILLDAAWELVREGLLRPGPRYFGVLNERPHGFTLTESGKAKLGI